MTIDFAVLSEQNTALGAAATVRFDSAGGTIGRSASNTWTLPDDRSFMSRRHAQVVFDGSFYRLIDLSSNGTFVNGARLPSGGSGVTLNMGDRIVMGRYTVAVTAVALPQTAAASGAGTLTEASLPGTSAVSNPAAPPNAQNAPFETASPPPFTPAKEPPPANVQSVTLASTPGAPVAASASADPIDDLLGDLGFGGAPDVPNPAAAQEVLRTENNDPLQAVDGRFSSSSSSESPFPDDWDPLAEVANAGPSVPGQTGAQPPTAPLPGGAGTGAAATPVASGAAPALPTSTPAQPPKQNASLEIAALTPTAALGRSLEQEALDAFFEGLGFSKASTEALSRETMVELGAALAASLTGLIKVLAARRQVKGEFRLEQTSIAPQLNNPLKFFNDGDEILERVVFGKEVGYQAIDHAVAEAFADIKAHEIAMTAGMRAASEAMLERFEPSALAEGLRDSKSTLLGGRSAKNWDAYVSRYKDLASGAADTFDKALSDEFAKAYAAFLADEASE